MNSNPSNSMNFAYLLYSPDSSFCLLRAVASRTRLAKSAHGCVLCGLLQLGNSRQVEAAGTYYHINRIGCHVECDEANHNLCFVKAIPFLNSIRTGGSRTSEGAQQLQPDPCFIQMLCTHFSNSQLHDQLQKSAIEGRAATERL